VVTATMEVSVSDETMDRLRELAKHNHMNVGRLAATLIEGALAADALEEAVLRRRLAQADAGGPFAGHEEVLAWLKLLAEGRTAPPPQATIRF
jgi:predicted transcriptional regulator